VFHSENKYGKLKTIAFIIDYQATSTPTLVWDRLINNGE